MAQITFQEFVNILAQKTGVDSAVVFDVLDVTFDCPAWAAAAILDLEIPLVEKVVAAYAELLVELQINENLWR